MIMDAVKLTKRESEISELFAFQKETPMRIMQHLILSISKSSQQ